MGPRVTAVGAEFDAVVREYALPGAALALYHEGEEVLWRGSGDLFARAALVDVASVSKAATSVAMLVLVDEGRVDLDSPVAWYWPEFGAGGKGGVLVRHLLTREAGVIGIRRPALPGDVWLPGARGDNDPVIGRSAPPSSSAVADGDAGGVACRGQRPPRPTGRYLEDPLSRLEDHVRCPTSATTPS